MGFVDLEAEEDSDDSEVDFEYAAVFHDEIDQEQVIEKKPEMDGCEFEEVDPAARYPGIPRNWSSFSSISSFEKPRVRFEGGHTGITFWEEPDAYKDRKASRRFHTWRDTNGSRYRVRY